MKPNIEQLPCFNQVAKVIGHTRARIELFKAVGWKMWFESNQLLECAVGNTELEYAFAWVVTPQGWDFWNSVDDGINPYTGEKV